MLKYQYELGPDYELPSYGDKLLARRSGVKAKSFQIVRDHHKLPTFNAKTDYSKLYNQQKNIMRVLFRKLEISENHKILPPIFIYSIKRFRLRELNRFFVASEESSEVDRLSRPHRIPLLLKKDPVFERYLCSGTR